MFKLTDNKLIEEGYCKYEDNFGNKLFIKKEDLSFTAKLRFKREGITAYIKEKHMKMKCLLQKN